jgi:hypothetical protein
MYWLTSMEGYICILLSIKILTLKSVQIKCNFISVGKRSVKMKYLSIMDFLRGQYVIYGPVRIILTEDEYGQLKVLNFYITYVVQYYYLDIKILKFYGNWNFWNIFKIFEIFIFFEIFEILNLEFWKFFEILWNFMKTEIFEFFWNFWNFEILN